MDPAFLDNDSHSQYFQPRLETQLNKYITRIIKEFHASSAINASVINEHQASSATVPESTHSLASYFASIKHSILTSTNTSSHAMVGHMTSSLPYFHLPIARLIVALNQNLVKIETASTFTALERDTIHMLHTLFFTNQPNFYKENSLDAGYCLGIVCSGGSVANLTALWIARNNAFAATSCFKSIKEVGLPRALSDRGFIDAVVIGSAMMHYSFTKALDILGFGDANLNRIPTNTMYQIRIDLLEERIKSLQSQRVCIVAIVGIAGTTETGSIDDLGLMARLAKRYGIHFHVDAAWGGPLIFSTRHATLLAGISECDSLTIDGHKQLYTPQGVGVLLLKNPTSALAIQQTSQYIIRKSSFDAGKYGVEGSRPANFLYLHAGLSLLGRQGYDQLLSRSINLVDKFWKQLIEHPSGAFECLHEPMTNILLYRYIPRDARSKGAASSSINNTRMDKFVIEIQERMKVEGGSFVSRTRIDYRGEECNAFRVVVSNPLTTWQSLEDLIVQQLRLGAEIEGNEYK